MSAHGWDPIHAFSPDAAASYCVEPEYWTAYKLETKPMVLAVWIRGNQGQVLQSLTITLQLNQKPGTGTRGISPT